MTTRSFHIGDIITVATGKYCAPTGMDGVYALLSWMVGEPVWTHQVSRAGRECEEELARQHPDLAAVRMPAVESEDEGRAWLAEQVARFGEYREVASLAAVDHTSIDPVTELKMMRSDARIIEI